MKVHATKKLLNYNVYSTQRGSCSNVLDHDKYDS